MTALIKSITDTLQTERDDIVDGRLEKLAMERQAPVQNRAPIFS